MTSCEGQAAAGRHSLRTWNSCVAPCARPNARSPKAKCPWVRWWCTKAPKAGANGSALTVLNHPRLNHRAEVRQGVMAEECGAILRDFFHHRRQKGPIGS